MQLIRPVPPGFGRTRAERRNAAFGSAKIAEVTTLAPALRDGPDPVCDTLAAARAARGPPRLHNDTVRARDTWRGRHPRAGRPSPRTPTSRPRAAAAAHHHHRLLPQTAQIRVARAELRRDNEYRNRTRAEIADVIALRERLGLDVLVHGEPERNDMVQYYAVGFHLGVYDIHSPASPASRKLPTHCKPHSKPFQLNDSGSTPDCGLKTRTTPEVTASLRNMVTAATALR